MYKRQIETLAYVLLAIVIMVVIILITAAFVYLLLGLTGHIPDFGTVRCEDVPAEAQEEIDGI